MSHVLSLIAAEAKAPLRATDVEAARRAIDAAGGSSGAPDWLAAGAACDVPFEGDAEKVRESARAALQGRPFDINAVAAQSRRKRLFLADMDSTVIGQECIDELAAEVGLREKVAAITARAMHGEIAFAPALRERVALLQGLPTEVVEKVLATRIAITPGAGVLVATMRASGAYAMLVSGGFTAFVEPIARRVGFDESRANLLLSQSGRFTGRVAEPILGADAKEAALQEIGARLGVRPEESLAVGDGANDAGMVRRAGLGVAYHAKPALKAIADAAIDHADLSALLFLQGYRRDEFVQSPVLPRP